MQERYSTIITDFLKSHPLIGLRPLENILHIPTGTIRQAASGDRQIPEKHIYPIICHLADYGLKIDDHSLTYDPADGMLSGRRWLENVIDEEVNGSFRYIIKESRWFATNYFDLPTSIGILLSWRMPTPNS